MIYPLKTVHEDERRALSEFGNGGNWKVCKYVQVKTDSVIGDHFHKNKDELFLLSKGSADVTVDSLTVKVKAPVIIDVKRETYHKFVIKKGSILICLASEEHDDTDDHK